MDNELFLYMINPNYLKYIHKIDNRVSVKYNNRPFVGVVMMINDIPYVLPLTSQTTAERKKTGKKKRSAKTTTFVKDSGDEEIANILHNNMFPVKEGVFTLLEVEAESDTYEANEIRYIRKNRDKIIEKAKKVHDDRIGGKDAFLNRICCDFEKLEGRFEAYKED